jgi:hypothetical protein
VRVRGPSIVGPQGAASDGAASAARREGTGGSVPRFEKVVPEEPANGVVIEGDDL